MPPNQPAHPTNHPRDHGWAWVTCFVAAVANFYVTGGVRSIGIMAVELIRFYNPNPVLVQLVTAFMGAGFAIFSFVGNILGVRFTMHRIAILGAILSITGKIISVFAPSMPVVVIGLGIISGMGYGFMFGPSMVLVGQYFVKRRALANGLAIAGGSFGQLTTPWYITGVMSGFAFRGGLVMYVGLALQALPAMFLLREPSFYGSAPASEDEALVGSEQDKDKDEETVIIARKVSTTGIRVQVPHGISTEHRPSVMALRQHRPSVISLGLPAPLTVSVENIANHYNVDPDEVTPTMRRRRTCQVICDPDLLCNPVFLLFVVAIAVGHSGYMTTCFFMPLYTNELWGSESLNAALISLMGVSDLVGRILGGFIADLDLLAKPYIIAISFVICGFLVLMVPFVPIVGVIFVCSICFGLVGGSYLSMLVVIIIELFGEPKLPIGLGLTTLCMGMMILPVPPILAGLSKRSGSYATAIRLSGMLMFIGSILFFCIMPVFKHRNCRQSVETTEVGVQASLPLAAPASSATLLPAVTMKHGPPVSATRPSISGVQPESNGADWRFSRINDDDAPESNL